MASALICPGVRDDQECRAEQVITLLETNAEGVFKWVQCALSFIHDSMHYDAMTRRLQNLDKLDLYDLYEQIWSSLIGKADEEGQSVIKILILFALHGSNPPMCLLDMEYKYLDGTDYEGHLEWRNGQTYVVHASTMMTETKVNSDDNARRLMKGFLYDSVRILWSTMRF